MLLFKKKDSGAEAAKAHGTERSPKWNGVRKAHLKLEPSCVACAKKRKGLWAKVVAIVKPVQVHHIYPFHVVVALGRPDLELDHRNLITLCESGEKHHICLGHLGDFSSFNPGVRVHAEKSFHGMTADQITTSNHWHELVKMRPEDLGKMSDATKQDYRADLDRLFPKAA
jgi:hypothetical protein